MLKIPRFVVLSLKMNPRVIPRFPPNRVSEECLFCQRFHRWISWAMLNIRFIVRSLKIEPSVTPKSGFERTLVFPGISKMDFSGAPENPTFCSAWLCDDSWANPWDPSESWTSGFGRMLVFLVISQTDLSGDAETHTFCRSQPYPKDPFVLKTLQVLNLLCCSNLLFRSDSL